MRQEERVLSRLLWLSPKEDDSGSFSRGRIKCSQIDSRCRAHRLQARRLDGFDAAGRKLSVINSCSLSLEKVARS